MEDDKDGCGYGRVVENRVSTLEREMGEVRGTLVEIRDKLLQRPSWSICIIITMLSSVSVGLFVAMVTRLIK